MIKPKTLSLLFLVMIWVVFSAIPAALSAETEIEEKVNPVADVRADSNGIWFSPKVSYLQLVLTISTPYGEVKSRTFEEGKEPYYELSSDDGDGPYSYELRVIPRTEEDKRDSDETAGLGRDKSYLNGPLVQSGAFYVVKGSIMMAAGTAEGGIAKPLDFNINDDLIVQGSACIGFDCVNGESFGFDTIRLKENNLRIKFDDTSTLAGFPNRDWQITINDSASGGANKFSIEDITGARVPFTIEGNAPTNSLYVDDGGRLGLRTATPVLEIHVLDGDTPGIRFDQSSSSGFAPQIWDVAGNEANFFIRDVTGGSRLPFRIRPGAPTSSIDIASSGRVGMGTASPSYPLHMKTDSSTTAVFALERTGNSTAKIAAGANAIQFGSVTNHPVKIIVNDATTIMTVNTDGSIAMSNGASLTAAGVWTNASSREFKENIQTLTTDEAFETLEGLTPVKYNYVLDKEDQYVGFIAEDVPELVASKDRKGMSPMEVVAVLTRVVQDQQKTIAELKAEINDIKNKKN